MRFIECSIESLHADSVRLACIIGKEWTPDTVAYLAKGGYLIGDTISRHFGARIVELSSHRNGESIKQDYVGIIGALPKWLRHCMREMELRYRLRKEDSVIRARTIMMTDRYEIPHKVERVLIVDDSADSGASLVGATAFVKDTFPNSEVKIAVINAFDEAERWVHIDWKLYRNCLLGTPASKDNSEFRRFMKIYSKGGSWADLHATAGSTPIDQ